jgi:tape measure domain-containing protein
MTTIAALNVRLGMDASNFSQGVNLARNEVAKVTSIMRQSVPATEKLRAETALLDKAFSATGKQSKEYANALAFLNRKYGEVQTTQTGMLGQVKQLAAAYLGFQTIKSIATIAADVETASVQFKVLTGSVEEANAMMADMREFAAASPLSLSGVQKAARTLMSFGTATETVMPKIRLLGDITGGNQQRFEFLSLAYAQASAAGRLMGQDLLQMINAGFNPLLEISEATGRSMVDLKKDMENGLISIAMVDEAMQRATGEGGRFNGMTEEMAKTFDGAYQQMVSAAQELAGTIGESVLPMVAALFRQIESLIRSVMAFYQGMTQTEKSLLAAAAAFAVVVPIALKIISIFMMIKTALQGVAVAQAIVLAFGGPLGWAALAGAAAAAGVAIYGINQAMNQVAEAAPPAVDAATAVAVEAGSAFDKLGQSFDDYVARMQGASAAAKAAAEAHSDEMVRLTERYDELMFGEDAIARRKLMASGMSEAQIAQIEGLKSEIKLLERKKQLEQDFADAQVDALRAAQQYFEQEKLADEERRKQITAGPQAADVGSAEAARIIAEQRNAQLANRMVPQRETTQEELVAKTKELLIAQAAEAKRQAELLIAVKAATAAMLDTRPKLFRG